MLLKALSRKRGREKERKRKERVRGAGNEIDDYNGRYLLPKNYEKTKVESTVRGRSRQKTKKERKK